MIVILNLKSCKCDEGLQLQIMRSSFQNFWFRTTSVALSSGKCLRVDNNDVTVMALFRGVETDVRFGTEGRDEGDADVFVNFGRKCEIDEVNLSGAVVRVPDGQAGQKRRLGLRGRVGDGVDGQDGRAALLGPLRCPAMPCLASLLFEHVVVIEGHHNLKIVPWLNFHP